MSLTQGAILSAQRGQTPPNPVLQVLNVKPLAPKGGDPLAQPRNRLILSDGVHYQQAMLATQLNEMVTSGQIHQFTVVRLQEYIVNAVNNKRIIIILNLEVVDQGTDRFGDPKNVDTVPQDAAAPAAPAAAPAAAGAVKPDPYGQQHQQQPPQQHQQQHQQQQSSYNLGRAMNGGGAGARGASMQGIVPIRGLNPYNKGAWRIKGRVTKRGDIRNYSNARGDGKLFSFDLLDKEGSEIRITLFNETCDRFYPLVEMGKVYVVAGGTLKMANPRWNTTNSDYEITLNRDGTIEPVGDDQEIAAQTFNFVTLDKLASLEVNSNVDVLAVVTNVGPLSTIVSQRSNQEMAKRTLTLVDRSGTSVDFTLWRQGAEEHTEMTLQGAPVVAIKGARISDFGGVSLNAGFSGAFVIEPDRPDAHELRQWYDTQGKNVQVHALSTGRGGANRGPLPRHTFKSMQENNLGVAEPAFFEVRGTVTFLRHDPERPPWYQACANGSCKKKVTEQGEDGSGVMTYHCEKCNQTVPMEPRYILSVLVTDWSDQQWATAFNDQAQQMLGRPASDVKQLMEGGSAEFEDIFRRANFKSYIFRCRAKTETHQDENRLKVSIDGMTPIDYVAEGKRLLEEINNY